MQSTQDVGTLELVELDFDHTPACEAIGGCGSSATWIGTTRCPCLYSQYACDTHQRDTEDWFKRTAPMICNNCHHDFGHKRPVDWRTI